MVPPPKNAFSRLRQRVADSTAAAAVVFLATIYLAGLPTMYTVLTVGLGPMTSEAKAWRGPTVGLFVGWVACAVLLGSVAFLRDGQVQALSNQVQAVVEFVLARAPVSARRREAWSRAVDLLLESSKEARLLRRYEPKVFIASPADGRVELVPLAKTDIAAWEHWPLTAGAIGATFRADGREPLVFTRAGLAELNPTLTRDQFERYRHITMVAATVIRDDRDVAIGVLSASSMAQRPRFEQRHREAMALLAANLGLFLEEAY